MSATLARVRDSLAGFERQELAIAGVRTVVHSKGKGPPLVFLHGAGTFTGFGYAQEWTRTHRVIIPYHPGFGESEDDRRIDAMGDYALHCLDLFDALGLGAIDLVGYSFGGWMAAETAILQPDRVSRLVLVAPSGLVVRDPPPADLLAMHPREVPAHLMHDPSRLKAYLPEGHDIEFLALRYREQTAMARVVWERPSGNPKLGRWLHRLRMPALLVWGDHDRIRPKAHADHWLKALPSARLELVPDAGHLVLEEAPATAGLIARFLAEPASTMKESRT